MSQADSNPVIGDVIGMISAEGAQTLDSGGPETVLAETPDGEVIAQQQDPEAIVEEDRTVRASEPAGEIEPTEPGADYSNTTVEQPEVNEALYQSAEAAGMSAEQLDAIRQLTPEQQQAILTPYYENERQAVAGIDPAIMAEFGVDPATLGSIGQLAPQQFAQGAPQQYTPPQAPAQPAPQQQQPIITQEQINEIGDYDPAAKTNVQKLLEQNQQLEQQLGQLRHQQQQFQNQQVSAQVSEFYSGFEKDKEFKNAYFGPNAAIVRSQVESLAAAISVNAKTRQGRSITPKQAMAMAHRAFHHDAIIGKAKQEATQELQNSIQQRNRQISLGSGTGSQQRQLSGEAGVRSVISQFMSR